MSEVVHNSVQQFRKNATVTQEELAVAVGVTRQTIIAIEKGNYTPSVLLAIKLANFFDTSVKEVFYLDNETK